MKFPNIALALTSTILAPALAFSPQSSVSNRLPHAAATSSPSSTALGMAVKIPDRFDWKGYYTNTDDSKVVKTGADVDFDPLGFADTEAGLFFMREAEIKHCRIAMLAAAGWPIAELLDRPLANLFGQQPVVDAMDRSPSLLNGGLGKIDPFYWGFILGAAAFIDLFQINVANYDPDYTPGDLGFDPLKLFPKDEAGQKDMRAKELRNGRLAMIAITAFAAQEFVTNLGVVDETPVFFKFLGGL